MASKFVPKFVSEVAVNIGATVLISLVVAVAGAIMTYLGSAWSKPLLVGGGLGLITLLIILAIRAILLMPQVPEVTTVDNVESRVRDWLHNFRLGVKNAPLPAAHFNFVVITDGGKTVCIARARDDWSNYLQFTAFIGPDEDERKTVAAFTEEEVSIALINTKLELSRARMGYSGLTNLTDGYRIFKRIPITNTLSEDVVIGMVWELEATLNTIFYQAVKDSHRFRKRIATQKANEATV